MSLKHRLAVVALLCGAVCLLPTAQLGFNLLEALRTVKAQRAALPANQAWQRVIADLGVDAVVDGLVEPRVACPCCGYRSLGQRGHYEICQICFWEDEGDSPLDPRGGPNHMTLREARENFQRIGACDEGALAHVLPDRRDRYA